MLAPTPTCVGNAVVYRCRRRPRRGTIASSGYCWPRSERGRGRKPRLRRATLGGLRKSPPLQMQTMLGAGASPVNCLALYRAAHCGDVSAMHLLLENGVDINKKSGTDGSPLQASSQSRKPEVLSFWVRTGQTYGSKTAARARPWPRLFSPVTYMSSTAYWRWARTSKRKGSLRLSI